MAISLVALLIVAEAFLGWSSSVRAFVGGGLVVVIVGGVVFASLFLLP
ncbi:MAG TPA: hypothetical protein VFD39_13590 [Trueperaceae bacterium]|nr:hypothetical protein [Trueperaceae bacterium]